MTAPRVGIEKLHLYPCSLALDMDVLCEARGQDPEYIHNTMLVDERSVNPPWEDPVTMAVNAAMPMLTDDDRGSIELLIVASESGLDYEKPLSAWVHRFLGLGPRCRNFEIKHACYAGTGALQMALAWVASGLAGEAKALVITTDQSRTNLGKPWEFVLGAGAAAMLVSRQPRFLEIEPGKNGYYSQEVTDLLRPTSRLEIGHADISLVTYMEALQAAYENYVTRVRCLTGEDVQFDEYFSRNVYHVPFGGITFRAHKALLGLQRSVGKAEAWEHFARRSLPALRYTRRMGGTYGSSTFAAMLGLAAADSSHRLQSGERIGIFAFGSGCCAEFYSGLASDQTAEVARAAGVDALLDARHQLTLWEYEQAENTRLAFTDESTFRVSFDGFGGWFDRHYRGNGYLILCGADNFERQYARS